MISHCPRCHDQVSVPAHASSETRVRCPLCQAEYSFSEVLNRLPPALIVLDAPSITPAAGLGRQEDDDYALVVEEDEPRPAVSQVRLQRSVSAAAQVRSRAARPQKSMFWEATKVALGALLAIPLAQLILWYLPGSWQRDPLDLGPRVSRYVPWVVPANLRAPLVLDDDDRSLAQEMPRPVQRGKKELPETSAIPGVTQQPAEDLPQEPAVPDEAVPAGFPATDLEPAELEPGSLGQEALEFAEAFADASAVHSAWDAAEQPDQTLAEQLYDASARLGEVVANSSTAEQRNWEPLDELLREISQHDEQLAAIAKQTPQDIEQVADGEGVVLIGAVTDVDASGDSAVTLSLTLRGRDDVTVAVISDLVTPVDWAAGEDFIVLGTAVHNSPSSSGDFAVRAAFAVPVEAAAPGSGETTKESADTVESLDSVANSDPEA